LNVALVVLVGMPGSGKSTVGRQLAKRLDAPFVDTDAFVESIHGRSPADLIRQIGEGPFRELEVEALQTVLPGGAVIATGGGVVTTQPGRDLLSHERCVYLHATPDFLVTRVDGSDRPLLDGDPAGSLVRLLGVRDKWYRQVSEFELDASAPLDDLVDAIYERVAGAP